MPELEVAPRAPALVAAVPTPSRPSLRETTNSQDEERSARRAREAEDRVSKAEARARRAEAGRSAAEQEAKAAVAKLEGEASRARRAENQLKKELDARARSGKGKRGKGEALEAKLAAAGERLGVALSRVSEAERAKLELEQEAKALETRNAGLARELAEVRKTMAEASARAHFPGESKHAGGVTRRDAPRTQLDVHFSPGDDCPSAIMTQIEGTQRSLDVCVFTITDDRITSTILDAHRRGVRVRIITDNDKAHDEGSDVGRLSRAGIEVREDDSPFHMHHKFAVFDGRMMLTGSYNWTRGAARNNQENLVVSSDPRLIAPFEREFSLLWARFERASV
jgi:phosphatidylserine/phosphatidylglycerophosphate/cardiolipin synthase-like enzyme